MPKQPRDFYKAVDKGDIGEEIIKEYLEKKGYTVYKHSTQDKPHWIDAFAAKGKEKLMAYDVKTKARFNKWPAQGINKSSHEEYKKLAEQFGVPFFLFFVDDKNGNVHAANLEKLSEGFEPNDYLIAWELKEMNYLFNIGEERIEQISKLDQRNYDYKPEKTTTPPHPTPPPQEEIKAEEEIPEPPEEPTPEQELQTEMEEAEYPAWMA
jgi:hypothetical protein